VNNAIKGILPTLFVAGAVAALGKVFIWGESVTNYGAYTPWGLWVGLYILLVGTAAGSAWTGLYAAYKNGGVPNRLTTLSFIVAGVSLAFGMAFIGTDLGKPMKGFLIIISPSFSSKLTWSTWLYGAFFACLAGFFYTKMKQVFMILIGIVSIGFLIAEGLFFSDMVARPMWNTWLTPISFLTSAVAAGSSMLCVLGLLTAKDVIAEEGIELKKIVTYSIIAHVAVEAVHLMSGISGGSEKAITIQAMWSSVPFWSFVIVGVGLPLLMLLRTTDRMNVIPYVLAFIGLASYKYSFIRYGFVVEPMSGLSQAFQHARLALSYHPSTVEWLVAIGFLAGMVWVSNIAIQKLLVSKQA
jgi:molybdopterin-containing oxidoreductase family membrane subunit